MLTERLERLSPDQRREHIRLTDGFAKNWQPLDPPDFEAILGEPLPQNPLLREVVLVDLVSMDIEFRQDDGLPIDVGRFYLQPHPQLGVWETEILACVQAKTGWIDTPGNVETPQGSLRDSGGGTGLTTTPPRPGVDVPYEDSSAPGSETRFNNYEILGELGRGGMGVVYQARQSGLNRLVALKRLLMSDYQDQEGLAQFRTEAEVIARLQHPNIVQVFEVGEQNAQPFFSMEFCAGGSLDKKLNRTPQPPAEAAVLVETLARAMHAAHKVQVIHRDLKPANVLLSEDGTPKITDFGLARKLDDVGQTQQGVIKGTPSYMAPEQAQGFSDRIGPSVDVYALGATLYECLTGRPPFKAATTFDTLMQVIGEEPVQPCQLNKAIPVDLETITLKCLRKEPAQRYDTAEALADDLRCYLEHRPIQARPVGRVERVIKWARRAPFQAATLAAGVALLLAVMAALYGWAQAEQSDARLRLQQLAERDRVDGLRERFTSLYTRAERAAAKVEGLPRGSRQANEVWQEVDRDLSAALGLVTQERELSDYPLVAAAQKLQQQARRQLVGARRWNAGRERLRLFNKHHGDAVFFAAGFTGLEALINWRRVDQEASAGLGLFGITTNSKGVPQATPDLFSPVEIQLIRERCHELLLLQAEGLYRAEPGNTTKVSGGRLRDKLAPPSRPGQKPLQQALALIRRAERLWPREKPTRSTLQCRANCLMALGQTEAAATARQEARRMPPRLSCDHFGLALERYRNEEFDRAVGSLMSILREQPDHFGAEYLLAVCRLRLGQHQAAHEGLSRCLKQRPQFVWPRLLRGYAAMELKAWSEARADYDEVLKHPGVLKDLASYVARVNRGVLAMRQREWEVAVSDLRKAIQSRPTESAAYLNLALTHRQRVWVPAVQQISTVILPNIPCVCGMMAVEAWQQQTLSEAVAVLDQAIARCPATARLHHERGRLHLMLGQARPARDDFQQAVKLALARGRATTLADDLIELGRLYYRERQHQEAEQAYRAALKVRPDRAVAWRLLAQPLLARKQHRQAERALDQFLKTITLRPGQPPTPEQSKTLAELFRLRGMIHSEQAQAFRARGVLHLRHQNLRAALDNYTQALKFQRDSRTLCFRGWCYLIANASELAQTDFDEALRLQPGNANALVGRANASIQRGQIEQAVTDVEKGLARQSLDPRTLYNAARVYAQVTVYQRKVDAARSGRRVLFGQRANRGQTSEIRTVALLRQALQRTPAGKRKMFWHQYVEADRVFDPLRTSRAMLNLARQYR